MATVFALIFIAAVGVTLYGVALAARALFHRGDTAHQVSAPSGIWTTRILWTGRGVAVGPTAQLVKRISGASPDKDTVANEEEPDDKSSRWDTWADFFSGFDEVFIWLAGAAALIALVVAAVLLILVALEVAALMLVGTLMGGLRAVRAHPWTIEIIDPLGATSEVKVRGLRQARRRHDELGAQIVSGEMTIAQVSDS